MIFPWLPAPWPICPDPNYVRDKLSQQLDIGQQMKSLSTLVGGKIIVGKKL